MYDYENQYIPYIPQKPVRLIQFRATQNPEICNGIYKAEGMRTNFLKYMPQCNLPYKNVNVTSFFKSDRIEKELFVFQPSNESSSQISELCSTQLDEGSCPDYTMSQVPGGVVPI